MIKLLIADDHAVVREGVKQIVQDSRDIVVVSEVGNGQEVLKIIEEQEIDVVLLDISMPGRSGLDIMKQLKKLKPELHILILTMHPEEQYAIRAFKAGASGYLNKKSVPDELLTAIRKVSKGRKYFSSSLAEDLVSYLLTEKEGMPHEYLSDREYEVMCLIASGKTVKEIASEMKLSVKTISTYRSRLLTKMNMTTNAELTQYSIQNSLV